MALWGGHIWLRAMIEHGIVETILRLSSNILETGHLRLEKGRCLQLQKPFKWCINPEESLPLPTHCTTVLAMKF